MEGVKKEMFEKYILVNPERYKASFDQSKTTGKIFFSFSVSAGNKRELFKESKEILEGLTKIANDFNKEMTETRTTTKTPAVKGVK